MRYKRIYKVVVAEIDPVFGLGLRTPFRLKRLIPDDVFYDLLRSRWKDGWF